MKTSYYGNIQRKNITNGVSISRSIPKWIPHLPQYSLLVPDSNLLSDYKLGIASDEEYVYRYLNMLDQYSPKKIYNDIVETFGDNVTLLCYEKPPQFCHRHLVAWWFTSNLNIEVQEEEYE